MIKFFGLYNFTCFKISFRFSFVDKRNISKYFLLSLIISNVCLPIDPVEPNIAIFFFHIINLKKNKNRNTKTMPSNLSSRPPCPGKI